MDSHLHAVLPVSTHEEWTSLRKLRWIQLAADGCGMWRWVGWNSVPRVANVWVALIGAASGELKIRRVSSADELRHQASWKHDVWVALMRCDIRRVENTFARGWLLTTHQNKPYAASAGSRNSLEAGYSVEKVLQDVATRRGKPQRVVSISASALCGFATRSRKETKQQEASYYGKIQLLSERSRQKRVSTKPVNSSEESTQIVLPSLHLSNAPLCVDCHLRASTT